VAVETTTVDWIERSFEVVGDQLDELLAAE
jgi:hypothetical protein